MNIESCIEQYVQQYRNLAQDETSFYARQPTLSAAIKVAASCRRADGKRHSHQRRIPEVVLDEAGRRLRAAIEELMAAKDFGTLHSVVKQTIQPVHGVGELTVYDVALRIGAFLGLKPGVVYLHAGTRIGAAALGFSVESIKKDELPDAFAPLTEAEIEDFLCIYKDALRGNRQASSRCGDLMDTPSCFSKSAHRSRPC
ncbi:MAG: hypothetical protein AAGF28_12285 [Pseudomonadota bacterium]